MTERMAEIIVALADNDLNVSAVADNLYMDRNTVYYHIDKIRKQLGKDPTKFYDLCKLFPIARDLLRELREITT